MAYPLAPMDSRSFKDPVLLRLLILSSPTTSNGTLVIHQKVVQIASTPLTRQVGVISCRHETHCFRRSCVEVGNIMRALLDLVRGETVLVVDNCVVRRLDVALDTSMCLKVEIKVESAHVDSVTCILA